MNTKDKENNKKLKVAINRDLSYEEIGSLIVRDPIRRNEELQEAIKFIDSIDGNASIFLDADWGSGKTVFVKQLEMILWQLNSEKDDIDIENKDEIINKIKSEFSIESKDNYLPVYYSAWANDCYDDPLATIVSEIAIKTSNKFKEGWDVNTPKIITDSLKSILDLCDITTTFAVPQVNVIAKPLCSFAKNIIDIKENIKKKDFFKQYKEDKELYEMVHKYLDAVVDETKSDKIILIIDELDRCKPSFALDLLESVKTLFKNDKLIVLYSVNTSELSKTVASFYGQGLDGSRYLQRFYDFNVPLKKINAETYIKLLNLGDESSYWIYTVSLNFSNNFNLSFRDMNLYITQIKEVEQIQVSHFKDIIDFDLLQCIAIPILIGIRIINKEDYEKISKSHDAETLQKYIFACKEASNTIVKELTIKKNLEEVSEEDKVEMIQNFSSDVIIYLYLEDLYNYYHKKDDASILKIECNCKKIFSKFL